MNLVDAVTAAFTDRTGRPPDGVWQAPGRVNLIGEHTDYNDGFVLPVAIDRSVVVAAARRDDAVLRCWSTGDRDGPVTRALADIGPDVSSGWSAYVEGMAWVLGELGVPVTGADVVVHADLPAGAGLSSSAALEAASGLAFVDLAGAGAGGGAVERVALALAAQRAETEVVGMPCGIMDQMAVLLGRAGHALFLDTRTRRTEHVPFDPAAAGLTLLVIDTRVKHALVGSPYAERRQACERAAAALGVPALRDVTLDDLDAARAAGKLDDATFRRARHVITENARVLDVGATLRSGATPAGATPARAEPAGATPAGATPTGATPTGATPDATPAGAAPAGARGGLSGIGPAFAGSHRSLRDDYEVSCAELDVAVESAVAAGAVAARMTGAGFGGSALALVPIGAAESVAAAVTTAFSEHDFARPSIFPVEVAAGAARIA
jgi:galactokinase